MKKFLMMAMMAAAATTAFAQDALVKEAKSLYSSGKLSEAIAKLTPALNSDETKDKAAAWNLLNDINYKAYQEEYQKFALQQPYDVSRLVNSLVDGYYAAVECDKYDQLPNEKGKVKPRFHKSNASRYQNDRQWLYNGGVMQYQEDNMPGTIRAWGAYIESAKSPLFSGITLPEDTLLADAAYNTALLSYQQQDYPSAIKYAEVAATFPDKTDEAMNLLLFVQKETCQTAADSTAYLARLTQLHKADPKKEQYFNLLQEYYSRLNDAEKLKAWATEEAQLDPTNKMAWALIGEADMNAENWEGAINAFKKAIEIDPEWTPCVFNTGICLNRKAIALNDELMDKRTMGLTDENAEKVKDVLREAKVYLERTRELDPNREVTNWAYSLYNIYYALGERDKMTELEAIDPTLKE